jgi:hypothetical protein
MEVYFPREVTESDKAVETGASPWDTVELRSETARLETESHHLQSIPGDQDTSQ